MAENLPELFVQISYELAAIKDLQQLLDIAVEQDYMEDLNKQRLRVDLLIRAYQSQIEYHYSELSPIMKRVHDHFRRLERS